jgi:hypothetical protein
VYPIKPWGTREELIQKGQAHVLVPITVKDARNMVIGLYDVLSSAKNDRDLQSLVGEEVMFYGTLLAVAGISVDSRAARNTGGALAGLATLLTGHYKPADQSLIFDKAAQRVDCLKELLRPVTDDTRKLFPDNFGDAVVAKAYNDIPSDTIEFVDTISKDLDAALKAVTLSSPSKDELANTMSSWKDSKDPKNTKDVSTTNAMTYGLQIRSVTAGDPTAQAVHDEMQAFSVAVKDYHTDGAACLVQHSQ